MLTALSSDQEWLLDVEGGLAAAETRGLRCPGWRIKLIGPSMAWSISSSCCSAEY